MSAMKQWARFLGGLSAVATAISFAACAETVAGPSTVTRASAAAPAAIVAGMWKLQSLTRSDSTVVNIKDPDRFTLEFLEDGTRVALRVDCNRAAGSYKTSGNTLTVGPALAMTKAYCAETAQLGDDYVTVISGDSTVTSTATSLQLASSRGTLRFTK